MTKTTDTKAPALIAWQVRENRHSGKPIWTRVGAARHHRNGSGLSIEISWEPNWLGLEDRFSIAAAHLHVRNSGAEPLPITGAGYRSHFTSQSVVQAAGGPVEYVLAWLTAEADTLAWRQKAADAQQLTLF